MQHTKQLLRVPEIMQTTAIQANRVSMAFLTSFELWRRNWVKQPFSKVQHADDPQPRQKHAAAEEQLLCNYYFSLLARELRCGLPILSGWDALGHTG